VARGQGRGDAACTVEGAVTSPVKAVVSFLRSRRLAIWLLLFVTAYSAIGTVIPQTAREADKIPAWVARYAAIEPVVGALGLHDAFRAPIFLVPMALLFLSTVACAWERTRAAARLMAPSRGLSEVDVKRLTDRPQLRVPVAGAHAAAATDAVRRAMQGLRMEVRGGKRAAEAVGGRWGLVGSPLFHWSLAALFLVIGLGQLGRAEGLIGVPVGYTVAATPDNFGHYDAGPWYSKQTGPGLVLGASDFQLETPIGGVDRGASAVITLRGAGAVVAEQRVYPNNPLRYGAWMIHQNDYGLAAALEVLDSSGAVVARAQPLLDFDPAQPSGMTVSDVRMTTSDGKNHTIEVSVTADRKGRQIYLGIPKNKVARVRVTTVGAATAEATLAPGAALLLPDGNSVRLKDIVYYTRLSVVDDWSVYPIYALFVLAGVGISLAVFAPYRAVRVLLVEGPDGLAVHAVAKHARRDPLFTESVEEALRAALGDPTAAPDGPEPDEGA